VAGALLLATQAAAVAAEEESRYQDSYPEAASKKGLQVEMVEDALALDVKHAALNVDLCKLVDPEADEGDTDEGGTEQARWTYKGHDFFFKGAYAARLDRDIKALSSEGVIVNMIFLVGRSKNEAINRHMLHPGLDKSGPNRSATFNSVTTEGRQWLVATMEFLAERWSRPDRKYGRVAGYIIGNEVNNHWSWSNRGRATMREFADDYLRAVRLAHGAVRRQSSWARVYVSLDHHWNVRDQGWDERQSFAGRAFLDYFAERARQGNGGDFDWHLAFHPYPENLFEPRFWNDKSALPQDDTPKITFKNLEVLTRYFQRKELFYNGKPRRIILSEQGFHTPDGPDAEEIQAAAYCLAYKKVEALDGIDAFILHRHVDHPREGGLRLGLRRYLPGTPEPRPKKKVYHCFRFADTPDWEAAFQFALPIVGIESWEQR